jgi:CRISPR-associated protein Cas1
MARHYYLTRSGRLRRKDNTLAFEPAAGGEDPASGDAAQAADSEAARAVEVDMSGEGLGAVEDFGMGDLGLEPEFEQADGGTSETAIAADSAEESGAPVRVGERRTIPVEDVDALWVFGELDLNARVLVFLARHKVPVHFVVRQVRHYSNRRLRLQIAREFVSAGLHNILRNLRYYAGRGVELAAPTESVQAEVLKLGAARGVDELMGCEGRARAAYYRGFASILRNGEEFSKRTRRPPDNQVNALISFTNGLAYAAALTQLYRTQLDPTVSFLHEPGARRFSLALDLAEVFKPVLADRLIFKLLNNRQLSPRDFSQDLNCCYLKESGRKVVLREWDARLQTTIEHRRLRRKVSYERMIRLECYKLVKHLTGVEQYAGFRAWW